MRVWYKMDGDGVDTDSDKLVTPAAKAVEAGCPICLESFEDKAFVDVCFHTFCFACILQWADVVSSCPMCKVPFKSIIHNVRGVDSYDQHEIKPKPVLVSQEVSLAEARRFWYRTTRLTSTRKGRKDGSSSKRSVSSGREIAAQKRRKAVYSANLWVKPITAEQGVKKIRVTNAQFYKSNPAMTHRLMPWLTREFKVIVGEENTSFMVALVNSMLSKHDITSPEFAENLRPFLFEQTEHFIHEFVSFAQSPYDMIAYDDNAEYDAPTDGTTLPQLLPVDNEPGPSGVSSDQQKLLDNLEDDDGHKFSSPVMKQCRGEDDTSTGSDSHDEEDTRNRKKKDEKSRSRSRSRGHGRDHSRDNGDKRIAHRDDYSRSRKMHADYYGNRDRYDNRDYYEDRSSRHRSHHHRHHHGYSSDSSTERHSYKRRRRLSSSRERHHSDRHRASRKDKKSKSSKSDRRRSRSPGRKKKRHHRHHSSDSSSPTRRHHDDNKKSLEITRSMRYDDDEILKQAPDDVLQDQLVNIESRINLDKKMLLKNLLRKERLELLHESLEKEQVVDDLLTTSDDNKLKEELQQLDEAITTGKNALMKVMKRIGSTESERTEQ